MDDTLLLGLDLGTSGVKAVLVSVHISMGSRVVADATEEYPLSTPHPGWSEQDPADWWQGVVSVIQRLCDSAEIDTRAIEALAVSGQMHGATLLDRSGDVLRPAILWNDQRCGPQCDAITGQLGLETLVAWVGNPALAGFTAPKIVWVREHEPEIYSRIATVLLPKDYITYRLTGQRATEVSDASGTLLFDVAHRRWSDDMLRALDLPASIVPAVHASTDVIGGVSAEAARQTGLREGTPVVAGGADNACAAVGLGVIHPGQVMTSLGTSGVVLAPSATASVDSRARLHSFCHAVPDMWYAMGVVLSAAGSLRWFRDTLHTRNGAHASEDGQNAYDVILNVAARVAPGAEGLLFLPYLSGERTPHGDPDARGVFFGLSLRHTRAHLARSVIEGVTFALGDSADIMRELGIDIATVRTSGGGARSTLWSQIQADVLDARVLRAHLDAGPGVGAAIIAGVGTGVFASFEEATDQLVQIKDEFEPDSARVAAYRDFHTVYKSLYPALKHAFKDLASVRDRHA
ncbi:MAG: xylulokinase [Chloroflexota bacterium]